MLTLNRALRLAIGVPPGEHKAGVPVHPMSVFIYRKRSAF